MDISERFSIWKEREKSEVVRHWKRPLYEQWCFPDRVRPENFSSEHGLSAESPSCLVSRSQTACAWRKPPGYARLVISCLGGRKKHSTRGKGSKNCFLTLKNFFSFSALCNGEIRPLKVRQLYECPSNTTITWAFYSSYSSWKRFTYKAWRVAWSGSKLIVEWCMHECVMLALWDTFATVILSTVMGKSTRWWTSKMFSWSVRINVCIRLDNDWTHK